MRLAPGHLPWHYDVVRAEYPFATEADCCELIQARKDLDALRAYRPEWHAEASVFVTTQPACVSARDEAGRIRHLIDLTRPKDERVLNVLASQCPRCHRRGDCSCD